MPKPYLTVKCLSGVQQNLDTNKTKWLLSGSVVNCAVEANTSTSSRTSKQICHPLEKVLCLFMFLCSCACVRVCAHVCVLFYFK